MKVGKIPDSSYILKNGRYPRNQTTDYTSPHFLYHTNLWILKLKYKEQPKENIIQKPILFSNNSKKTLNISDLEGFYTFQRQLPDAQTCATNRMQCTHLGRVCMLPNVNALRMRWQGPTWALSLPKGALKGLFHQETETKQEWAQ